MAHYSVRQNRKSLLRKDYTRFREHRRMLFELLKNDFATAIILYLGYSNQDFNWQLVLDEMSEDLFPSQMPQSYRVAPSTDPLDLEILKDRGIETIECTLKDFVESASISLSISKSDAETLRKARTSVPPDLADAFDKNPVPVARLLASWTYVNQVSFHEPPNLHSFLRGDRANWGLIGSNQHFERDIEEQIYDDLLDYATLKTNRPNLDIVMAPAGYGISTLLMSIAATLVQDRTGPVFMLNPGCDIIEGDVEFASNLLPGRPVFFVDNAADHSSKLYAVIHRLQELHRPAMFVLGNG